MPDSASTPTGDAMPSQSSTSSTTSTASFSHNVSLEEEEITLLDANQIAKELHEMTLYLDELELKLQTGVPACSRPEEYDETALELYGSQNESVRKLQKDAMKLQHQVDELQECSKGTKSVMITLQNSLCILERQKLKNRRRTESIESIKHQMDLDGGRCQQRYKYLRDLCYNWSEVYENTREMKRLFDGRVRLLYSKAAYHKEKRGIFIKLEETEAACVCAKEELMQQAKHMKGWVNVLIESEPLCNSIVSVEPTLLTLNEYDDDLHTKRQTSNEMLSSVSFSTGWYDRMSSMIKKKSFFARRL